jgi:uncharacterized protein (TIGR01777 family)
MKHVQTFRKTTRIRRPASEVFAWHERPCALERLTPPWEQVEVLESHGGVHDGGRVLLRSKVGPAWVRWEALHRDYDEGRRFCDVQVRGPFAVWEHEHRVESDGPAVGVLTDEIGYRLPLGGVGQMLGGGLVRRRLKRLFAYRHAVTRDDLLAATRYGAVRSMRFLVSGASGLIGRALVPFLRHEGHEVVRLVRRKAAGPDEIFWDPTNGLLDLAHTKPIDAVIHLAGEPIASGRWTDGRRAALLASRVKGTRTLVGALERLRHRPFVMVSASATGFFGDRGSEVMDENDRGGGGFLADVCDAWEHEAQAASALGIRVAMLRTGLVLTPQGGALAKMLPVFRAGLGGKLGSGRQWMSWISIDDVVGAYHHAVLDQRCTGPVNAVAPEPVTNSEFAATLAEVLGRPALCPVPKFALKLAFGQLARETLLASTRVIPERLLGSGYPFRHVTLEGALRHVLGRTLSEEQT